MVVHLESFEKRFTILNKTSYRGDLAIEVGADSLHALLRALKEDLHTDFNVLMDLTAVDYPNREKRFEMVYHLYSLTHNHRLRVKASLPAKDPVVDSVTNLWTTADWYEREVFDMFGIRFIGHPNLKRLLMPESFEGHPLRKDYPATRRQKIPVPIERP